MKASEARKRTDTYQSNGDIYLILLQIEWKANAGGSSIIWNYELTDGQRGKLLKEGYSISREKEGYKISW